jgi:hypothetical protein
MEKLPSEEAETPRVLPFIVIVAAEILELSFADNTLPVMVRFCANNIVPHSSSGIISNRLITNISVAGFGFKNI